MNEWFEATLNDGKHSHVLTSERQTIPPSEYNNFIVAKVLGQLSSVRRTGIELFGIARSLLQGTLRP